MTLISCSLAFSGAPEVAQDMADAMGSSAAASQPAEEPVDAPEQPAPEEAAAEEAATRAVMGTEKVEGEGLLVAILDLKHGEADAGLASAIGQVITSEIAARDGYRALSRNELRQIIQNQAESTMLGCDTLECQADLAKLAAADRLVTGTLDTLEGAQVVTLSLIDPSGKPAAGEDEPSAPEVLQRSEVAWRGDPAELVRVVRPLLDRLLSGPDKSGLIGSLEVSTEAGATIFVDGQDRGSAPLDGPITGLSSGPHFVEIQKDGFGAASKHVVVQTGETEIVRISLEAEPYYTQWWFWTAVGGGAAVAVAGGTAIAIAALSGDTTVSVKVPLPAAVGGAQ